MSRWQVRLWRWTAGLFALVVILMAAVAGLFRLLTPLVPTYRVQVEQWASAAIQRPVEIRSMGAEWSWRGPEVTLEDVRIFSHDRSRVVIAAREVQLGVGIRSLLRGKLPAPNRIELVAPQLEVQRDAHGVFSIVGLEGAQTGATDWKQTLRDLFAQPAVLVVKNGELTFVDARMPAPAVFQKLDLSIDNEADSHDIEGDVQLPQVFGRSLRIQASIAGEDIDPKAWDWHARVQGVALNLPRWFSYWPEYGGRFTGGRMDLDAQAAARGGELRLAVADVDAENLATAPQAFPTSSAGGFSLLQGRVAWTRTQTGWRLEGKNLELQRHNASWPAGSFSLEYAHGAVDSWSGDVGFLRLQDLTVLAGWLPPSIADTQRLLAFSPAGDISDSQFKLQWDGKSLGEWSVKGRFLDLGVRAAEGWPGFTGVDGALDLNQMGGSVMLDSRDLSVDFTPLFRAPLHADSLDMTARVTHEPGGWRVASDGFTAVNADGAGHGHGGMFFPADGSAPVLDLDATVDRADAHNKSAYFPVGIMPKDVVKWLDDSIKAGQVDSGSVSIHGKTSDFPYRDGKGGTFDIQFHLVHGELDYSPGWPALKELDADVRFLDQGLDAHARGGKVMGDDILPSHAWFADLATGVLQVEGAARGDAENGLEFLRHGPLKRRFGGTLDGLEAKGETDISLALKLPVTDPQKFVLDGKAMLKDVSVDLKDLPDLAVQKLNGDVGFSGDGFGSPGLNGRLLDGPVTIAIHPKPGKADITVFNARGRMHGEALASVLKLGNGALSGETGWKLDGNVPNDPAAGTAGLALNLHSDLQGLAVGLAAPFAKSADQALSFMGSLRLLGDGRMEVTGGYGAAAQARLDFTQGKVGWQLDRGNLHLGAGSAQLPETPGLTVNGALQQFAWDDWKSLIAAAAAAAPAPEHGATSFELPLPAYLRSLDLDIGRFSGLDQNIDGLHLDLDRGSDVWQARLDSASLAGSILLPFTVDADHPIALDMDRVTLTKPPAPAGATTLPAAASVASPSAPKASAAKFDPRRVPAVRFSSRKLVYGDMSMDNVTLTLVPQPDGVALENLKVSAPTFSVSGDGTWKVTPAGLHTSAINADVEGKDVEKTLRALGYDAGITGDKGSIVASLNWHDSPFGDVVDSLGGTLSIKLADGQLTEVQPGAGRVFGLLSLNALPRRLLLNFSDVFSKGFGYDSIEGDFTLENGVAATKDLQMKGPAARISIIGTTDLGKQKFDEILIVDPNVGSALPVVGALAGGVGVGAVVLLLTQIFKKPLTAAGQSKYQLTGSWSNPVLTKLASTPPVAATAAKPQ
ncbi:MAG TPA: YhdP family protein [Gammaproteobacteria bacterium]|nr:YhdP family protein [Gammaproteobacteria bacterium]